MVTYAAMICCFPKVLLVREVQSHSCEGWKPQTRQGKWGCSPPSPAVASRNVVHFCPYSLRLEEFWWYLEGHQAEISVVIAWRTVAGAVESYGLYHTSYEEEGSHSGRPKQSPVLCD